MSNYYQKFMGQLTIAEKYQEFAANTICSKYYYTYVSANTNSDWDVVINHPLHDNVTIEVKNDYQAVNNFFIEYESRGHDSGINVTKSDFYCYICTNPKRSEMYIIKTEKLKELVQNANVANVVGGDGHTSKGYLLNINKYSPYFKKIENIEIPNYYDNNR